MPNFDSMLLWALVLLMLGLGCVVLEFFVPSAGMLGVLAALSIFAAIGMAFMSSQAAGVSMVVAVTLLIPLLLALAVRYWPHTPIGKAVVLSKPEEDDVLPQTAAYRTHQQLVGQLGLAENDMLPSGVVNIGGQSYDAISHGLPIESGQTVRVVGLDTQRLVVRAEANASPVVIAAAREAVRTAPPEIEDPFA